MLKIKTNYSLRENNSFRLDVRADKYLSVNDVQEFHELFRDEKLMRLSRYFIGEGSNILFTKPYLHGLVIKVNLLGKKIISQNSKEVILEIGAGENWHNFVTWTVEKDWGGVENLAFIPGLVGAAPIQNIAAYGGNFSDVFINLKAFDFKLGKIVTFTKEQCHFSYRQSIFKSLPQGRYAVVSVRIRLSKNYQLNTSYFMLGLANDSLVCELKKKAKPPYKVKDIYRAVISIRKRKLPDVDKIPSVGSFFLNPVISRAKLLKLQRHIPDLQYYPVNQLSYHKIDDQQLKKLKYVKIAAGRLLDEMGVRGKKIGNVSVYDKHALVIVHNGKAKGQEILRFAKDIMRQFYKKYKIKLETEVNIV